MYRFDAFLSHAIEDKAAIANELCDRLTKAGFKIWYSGKHLRPGRNITDQVHLGINKSRCGIFILSPQFMQSEWTKREYHVFVSKEKFFVPIHYGMRPEELAPIDPNLIDRYGIDARLGMDVIVERLTNVILQNKIRRRKRVGIGIIATVLFLVPLVYFVSSLQETHFPSAANFEDLVAVHVKQREANMIADHRLLPPLNATKLDLRKVHLAQTEFNSQKSYYRNEYEFSDGTLTIRARKNVQAHMNADPALIPYDSSWVPTAAFEIAPLSHPREVYYQLRNTKAVRWTLSPSVTQTEGTYDVTVNYENIVREASVRLTFAVNKKDKRYNRVFLYGFPATEHLLFVRKKGVWALEKVR